MPAVDGSLNSLATAFTLKLCTSLFLIIKTARFVLQGKVARARVGTGMGDH